MPLPDPIIENLSAHVAVLEDDKSRIADELVEKEHERNRLAAALVKAVGHLPSTVVNDFWEQHGDAVLLASRITTGRAMR